ncbi:MFS transporter [uncultured Arthrobacter sp.]|uniref:MFS transporter n=1 Tax=uncultured Arthrobacter sp. TaxID=114050 RepID=UPI0025E6F7A4|nr:MFS transporter [uncultured Arthrobacter sp.]
MVLCTALALDALDVSMVGVALPSIGAELGLGTESLQWIVSAYVLGYGSLLLLGGRMADLLGRRRIFLIALSVFAAASLLGGLVDDPALLIATRFIKGLAAAFTAPAAFSIITTNFAEGRERNRAVSIFTTFGASGFSLGLVVGGLMTSLSWRFTFLVSVPVAVAIVLLGLKYVPRDTAESRDQESGHDLWGALTLAAGMLGLVYTLVAAPGAGWGSAATIIGFAASAAVLITFALIEKRVPHPLIRFGILKEGAVARANLSAVGLFGSYLSFQFILTLYLQSVLGWTPLNMALALLPTGLLVASSAPFADRLINKFGTQRLILTGLASLTLGYLLFLRVGTTPNYVTDILPSVLLLGVGFALAFPSINVQATAGIRNTEQGLAAGLIQTSTQVGAALVLAVATALVSSHSGPPAGAADAQAMLEQYRPGMILSAGVAMAALLVAGAPARRKNPVPAS